MGATEFLSDSQLQLIINDIQSIYHYNFSEYSKASLKRRVTRLYTNDKFPSFAEFRHKLLSNPEYFNRFIEQVTVNVTEMFRDPLFFNYLREHIIPVLGTYPLIRIWHAGCSTGEEVYSMAILLKEANLLNRSLLYATDINPSVLEKASEGCFSINKMQDNSENYILSGGKEEFSIYYRAAGEDAQFDRTLRERMIFSTHNLVSDGSFNQFQLIMCRNVLIYFEKQLQDKVLKLFHDSLEPLGYLALGLKETINFSPIVKDFSTVSSKQKIWRKTK